MMPATSPKGLRFEAIAVSKACSYWFSAAIIPDVSEGGRFQSSFTDRFQNSAIFLPRSGVTKFEYCFSMASAVPRIARVSPGTLKPATCGHFKTSQLLIV